MHYYINWALCNLPTFILPGTHSRKSAGKKSPKPDINQIFGLTALILITKKIRLGLYGWVSMNLGQFGNTGQFD